MNALVARTKVIYVCGRINLNLLELPPPARHTFINPERVRTKKKSKAARQLNTENYFLINIYGTVFARKPCVHLSSRED